MAPLLKIVVGAVMVLVGLRVTLKANFPGDTAELAGYLTVSLGITAAGAYLIWTGIRDNRSGK